MAYRTSDSPIKNPFRKTKEELPHITRAQISADQIISSNLHLTDSYEGYQPRLYAVDNATVTLNGDILQ